MPNGLPIKTASSTGKGGEMGINTKSKKTLWKGKRSSITSGSFYSPEQGGGVAKGKQKGRKCFLKELLIKWEYSFQGKGKGLGLQRSQSNVKCSVHR